jgi:hypothetical protein
MRAPLALSRVPFVALALACGPRGGGVGGATPDDPVEERRPEPSYGSSHLRGEPAPPPEDRAAAAEADFLTPMERDLGRALDELRRAPKGYARVLRAHRARFDGKQVLAPGETVPIMTIEGTAAVDEAIAAVSRTEALEALEVSPALSRVARAHAEALGRSGAVDHTSADGKQPHERMEAAGRLDGRSGENIGTGYADGAMMLLSLVVDDGVPSRGHRKNLLEPDFRVIGIGCAKHAAYRWVCVLDLAESFD